MTLSTPMKLRKQIEEGVFMKATNIEWDLETLPTEVEIPDGMEDEEEISDYLSDLTGFCHKGFCLE